MIKDNDLNLITQYLQGDEKSLQILIGNNLKLVYSFVYHYVGNSADAEDITQTVWVQVWRNLKKFDQQKSFKTWVLSITKNACLDFLKKKKNLPFSSFEKENGKNFVLDTIRDSSPLPAEQYEQTTLAFRLNAAINKLSDKYSKVLRQHFFSQSTFQEIAVSTGESLNTVKSRYRRALLVLRKILVEKQ
ncbi:MAG: sigma-70 family RNA polymerase sigma factor [Candidatus Parcubacteria bacterium]|nr:sigma-70 family RNA polymerase sigma factor [Candidatus Parcubacteria bacterium]